MERQHRSVSAPVTPSLSDLSCACGGLPFSIKPGADAEYAVARDSLGREDEPLGRILIARAVPDRVLCLKCQPKRKVA